MCVFLWCGRGPCVLQCVHVCVMCKGLVFMKTYSVPDLSSCFTSFRSTYSLILDQNVAGFFFCQTLKACSKSVNNRSCWAKVLYINLAGLISTGCMKKGWISRGQRGLGLYKLPGDSPACNRCFKSEDDSNKLHFRWLIETIMNYEQIEFYYNLLPM